MDINYELYKVFYYVATSLSFSEASKQLYISQSAVSQSIKTLEKRLNQNLFIRSTKKVRLTTEGEILLRHIEPAINLIQRGENQIIESNTLGGGQLRIGASDTICRYFLVPYLNKFHKAYPNTAEAFFHRFCRLVPVIKFSDQRHGFGVRCPEQKPVHLKLRDKMTAETEPCP